MGGSLFVEVVFKFGNLFSKDGIFFLSCGILFLEGNVFIDDFLTRKCTLLSVVHKYHAYLHNLV